MTTKAKKAPAKGKALAKAKKEIIDPRQIAFITGYQDPKSPTFGNAYASAVAAKYSESYAKSITVLMPDSLSEIIGNDRRVKMAEKHLDEVLGLSHITQAMGAFGPLFDKKTKKPIMVANTGIIKEKTKVAEIVLPALKKDLYGKQSTKIGFNFNITPSSGKQQFSS